MILPRILHSDTGHPLYSLVVQAEPGVLVSLFDENMRQITGWAELNGEREAEWLPGTVSEPREAAYAVLSNGRELRALDLHMRPRLHPDNMIHLDLSRVDRVKPFAL